MLYCDVSGYEGAWRGEGGTVGLSGRNAESTYTHGVGLEGH